MELLLVEAGISASNSEIANKLGPWATGNWLTDKFYDPTGSFAEVSVDYTTAGFDEAQLVRIGDLAVQAA